MFYCERCATRFNAAAASSASNCPRCRARDGVAVPLSFRLFEVDAVRSAGVRPRRIPPAGTAPAGEQGPVAKGA